MIFDGWFACSNTQATGTYRKYTRKVTDWLVGILGSITFFHTPSVLLVLYIARKASTGTNLNFWNGCERTKYVPYLLYKK